jgi:alkylation response protein AidB-like acyl-CoA dehydrogenase
MNFDYSDEQKLLKKEARRFLADRCPPARVRAVLENDNAGHDPDLWKAIAEQGWQGAAIPEAYGGLGLGYVELCALAEELGRALAPTPFASSVYFFAEALILAGDEAQKKAVLPGIASGDFIGCIAVSEGPGPVTPDSIRASVREGRLSGVKLPVTDGAAATHAMALAKDEGGFGLFMVELSAGVDREALKSVDPSRGVARLAFDAAPCIRVGPEGQGFSLVEQVFDRAAVPLAFEQCGGADRCLELATDYAKERFAFGRQIGSYQAIKHKLADMFIKNELARSNAYHGAWALNTNSPELPLAASSARIAASEAFWYASKENIQVHGGMGFTWQADAHMFYRRSRQLALVAGAPPVWRERLVQQLEKTNVPV